MKPPAQFNRLASLSMMDIAGLHPFNPKINKPVQLPGGNIATEYSATGRDDSGKWVVYPQIWWGADGNPVYLPDDQGLEALMAYEGFGNPALPRFNALAEAEAYAANRSQRGGGMRGQMGNALSRRGQ